MNRSFGAVLMLLGALAACGQRAEDGLAMKGKIAPVTAEIGESIAPDQITDAQALLGSLQGIRDQSPPQDYANTKSVEARRRFYRARLRALLPENASILLPLGCVGGPEGALSFDPNSRNLVVRISNYDDSRARAWRDEVLRYLRDTHERLLEDQRFVVLTGQSRMHIAELGLPEERERALSEFTMAAQIRRLPAGPRIAITNNPVGSWHFRLRIAISHAAIENLNFQVSIFEGSRPEPGSFARIFRQEVQRWSSFPIDEGMEPFFHKRIPYADPVEGLCLIAAFRAIDLREGGELAVPMTGAADFIGNLTGWLIVERSSGRVVHRERAPPERSGS